MIPHRRYQVEVSENLRDWDDTGSSFTVPVADTAHQWMEPVAATVPSFYRVKISLQ